MIVTVLLLAGCGSASRPPAPPAAKAAARHDDPRTEALIDERCASCHDGQGSRPKLWPAVTTDRDLALRAALVVSARRMPPPETLFLSSKERAVMIGDLCTWGAKDPATCRNELGPSDAPIVRSPGEFLRASEDVRPGTPTDADLRRTVMSLTLQTAPSFRAGPESALLTALLAAERCRSSPPEAFEACVRSVVDFELWAPRHEEKSGP